MKTFQLHLIGSRLLVFLRSALPYGLAFASACALGWAETGGSSQWVSVGKDGKLVYQGTPAGDRIMDFSGAGYGGGGIALPEVKVEQTVRPSGGEDDTAAIQAAIDSVGRLPLKNGFRGAVLLAPGTFTCSRSLVLSKSGVVLRGSGSEGGARGTTIKMVGSRHRAVLMSAQESNGSPPRATKREDADPDEEMDDLKEGRVAKAEFSEAQTSLSDPYVPAGTSEFGVVSTKGFAEGDRIAIRRPSTPRWIEKMEMHTLKRDGRAQTWIGRDRSSIMERTIVGIAENRIMVDLPLADSFDATLLNPPGTTVTKLKRLFGLSHLGLEHMRFQCPPLEINYGSAPYSGARVEADDSWIRDVVFEETMNTLVLAARRITVQGVVITHTYPNLGPSKPTDFSIEGSQILIDRCQVTGDNEYFVWTASLYPGPNVVLNSTFNGRGSRLQPHMRWSTGLLVDNCRVPDGGIDFPNRGVTGSGHGWTMGWAVAWNCTAKNYVIQQPPGAANWAIGCVGERLRWPRYFDTAPLLPEGYFDSHGSPVVPRSLYLAQLAERRGEAALEAIGYRSPDDPVLVEAAAAARLLPDLPVAVDPELGPDLATRRPIETRRPRDGARTYAGEKAVDGDPTTFWEGLSGARPGATGRPMVLIVDTEGPVEVNAVSLEEPPALRGNIREYTLEGQVDSDWKVLATGTTIGERKVQKFPAVSVWKVRLTLMKAEGTAGISTLGLYRAGE